MALVDLERDVQRLCLATAAPTDTLERLGDARVWGVYRDMVRRRLLSELKHAYRRTHAAVGDSLFREAFTHYMAETPPRERYFHAIPAGFEATARAFFQDHPAAPAHACDLVSYEAARWAVSDLDDRIPDPEGVGELSFDGRPVISPALRVLRLGHPVQRTAPEEGYPQGTFYVALHRASDDQPVKAWSLNRVAYQLLLELQREPESLTCAIQTLSQSLSIAIDQPFLDGLCATLADFCERRIVLGSRAPA